MRFIRHAAVLLVASSIIAGCVTDPVTGERHVSVVNWTPEEERQLGRDIAPNVESQFEAVYLDPEARRYLGDVIAEMIRHSVRREDFEFNFKILNSSIPNAFALPGGHVYITRGLLTLLESEAQFVSVMGHELGHVEHQHSMRNQGRLSGVAMAPLRRVVSMTRGLPGENVVGLAAGVASAPLAIWGLQFNREQELEADRRGVFFSATMDYDPREGKKTFELFERLEAQAGAGAGELSWLRSHPLNQDRVDEIEATVAHEYPQLAQKPENEFRHDGEVFGAILERLRARAPGYAHLDEGVAMLGAATLTPANLSSAKAKLDEAAELLPAEPLISIARGEAAILEKDMEGAQAQFEAAAVLCQKSAPEDGHWKVDLYLGILALEPGKAPSKTNAQNKSDSENKRDAPKSDTQNSAEKALTHLTTASERFPQNPAVHLYLAMAYEKLGRRESASAAYRKAMDLSPTDSEVYKQARAGRSRL